MYYIDDIHGIKIIQIDKRDNSEEKDLEPVAIIIYKWKWPLRMTMTGREGDSMRIKTGLFTEAEEKKYLEKTIRKGELSPPLFFHILWDATTQEGCKKASFQLRIKMRAHL